MKKIKNFIICLAFAFVACLGSFGFKQSTANATGNFISHEEYSTELANIFNDFCGQFKSRIAGSENEKEASNYIKQYLLSLGLTAKNNTSTNAGVQTFKFLNDYTGLYCTSQNIIFEYKSANLSGKKVILACNYDAPLYYDEETDTYVSFNNDALSSAGSVASMLMLASTIASINPNFDVEFVFFGAGENSCAGSEFYLDGISKDEKKDILCVVNIDKVAVGENIYFYIDEITTEFSKYVSKTCSAMASEINLSHLNKSSQVDSKLNLGYSHIALNSDNENFMSSGLTTINFFAGEYEQGVILGINEHNGKAVVSYTKDDTLDYVKKTFGETEVFDNLYKVQVAISTLLSNENFEAMASNSAGNTNWFYKIFANERLASYLTIVAFFVILIVAMYIYYKLSVKSYSANVEVEFLSSVVKISDQIDTGDSSADVTKVVGQVLANDIKKDNSKNSKK